MNIILAQHHTVQYICIQFESQIQWLKIRFCACVCVFASANKSDEMRWHGLSILIVILNVTLASHSTRQKSVLCIFSICRLWYETCCHKWKALFCHEKQMYVRTYCSNNNNTIKRKTLQFTTKWERRKQMIHLHSVDGKNGKRGCKLPLWIYCILYFPRGNH